MIENRTHINFEQDADASELDEVEEIPGTILIAHHQATVVVLEPGEQAFDHPAAPETTQAAPILCFCSLAIAPMRGNESNATVAPEALVQGITVIGSISDQRSGSASVKHVSRTPSTQRTSWG